jgi:basic membrane protein A
MLKRVDVAVYNALKEGTEMTGGMNVLDLKAGGVGYAMDENNAALVSADMLAAVDAASAKIVAGEIVVHDYMSDNTCPGGVAF